MSYPKRPPGMDGFVGVDADGAYVYERPRVVEVQAERREWEVKGGEPVSRVIQERVTQVYPFQRLCPWREQEGDDWVNRWQAGDAVKVGPEVVFTPNPFAAGFDGAQIGRWRGEGDADGAG